MNYKIKVNIFCKEDEFKKLEKLRSLVLKITNCKCWKEIKLNVSSVYEMCPNLHTIKHKVFMVAGLV